MAKYCVVIAFEDEPVIVTADDLYGVADELDKMNFNSSGVIGLTKMEVM